MIWLTGLFLWSRLDCDLGILLVYVLSLVVSAGPLCYLFSLKIHLSGRIIFVFFPMSPRTTLNC